MRFRRWRKRRQLRQLYKACVRQVRVHTWSARYHAEWFTADTCYRRYCGVHPQPTYELPLNAWKYEELLHWPKKMLADTWRWEEMGLSPKGDPWR
jgi:hypothetical protein